MPEPVTLAQIAAVLLGWPSIIGGLGLMAWGLTARKRKLVLAGVIVSSGFCLYLTAMNWVIGIIVYAGNWASYYLVRARSYRLAWYALLPFVLITAQLLFGLLFG